MKFEGTLLIGVILTLSDGFSTSRLSNPSSILRMDSGGFELPKIELPTPSFPSLPNPFGGPDPDEAVPLDEVALERVAKAKAVLATDLGIADPSLLAEDFVWIGAALGSAALGKRDYVAAGKFFNLR